MAECLFREQGYDATTVDHIAKRAGISQRTFFRYAGTKEDLVLGEFERQGERMVDVLRSRPAAENPWTSLRHAFEVVVASRGEQPDRARAKLMNSIIESSPALRAAYLDRMELIQRRLVDVLLERAAGTGSRVVTRALVGSAFAALNAVVEACDCAPTAAGRTPSPPTSTTSWPGWSPSAPGTDPASTGPRDITGSRHRRTPTGGRTGPRGPLDNGRPDKSWTTTIRAPALPGRELFTPVPDGAGAHSPKTRNRTAPDSGASRSREHPLSVPGSWRSFRGANTHR
ncbi:TetR family transcriptional regulator [Nocardiopsis sp. ARC36]